MNEWIFRKFFVQLVLTKRIIIALFFFCRQWRRTWAWINDNFIFVIIFPTFGKGDCSRALCSGQQPVAGGISTLCQLIYDDSLGAPLLVDKTSVTVLITMSHGMFYFAYQVSERKLIHCFYIKRKIILLRIFVKN